MLLPLVVMLDDKLRMFDPRCHQMFKAGIEHPTPPKFSELEPEKSLCKPTSEKSIVSNCATRVCLRMLQTIISARSVMQTFLKNELCVKLKQFCVHHFVCSVHDEH